MIVRPGPVPGSGYTALVRFAPEYVANVLNENFEDAKKLFAGPLIAIHYAHLVMLSAQKIVSAADARAIRDALDALASRNLGEVKYDGTYEDLFFYVERLVIQACGDEVAGRLHTARSRNDIDMTMYRMRQRELVLSLLAAISPRMNSRWRIRYIVMSMSLRERAVCRRPAMSSPQASTINRST